MCCAFFWLNAHPQLLLLLAFNRDEFLGRPTERLHVWKDADIIGGRDRVNGGTWLGMTRSGRFAFVTNFREVGGCPRFSVQRGCRRPDEAPGHNVQHDVAGQLRLCE